MKFLIVLATLVYIAYDWASVKKNKNWPESLSATYYLWPKWVFPLVMTLVGFSMLPVWLEATEGSNLQFLSFLSSRSNRYNLRQQSLILGQRHQIAGHNFIMRRIDASLNNI